MWKEGRKLRENGFYARDSALAGLTIHYLGVWVFSWGEFFGLIFLLWFGFGLRGGLGGKGWKEIEYLLSSSQSDLLVLVLWLSSALWETSFLGKHHRNPWHSWVSFWLCINVTAEPCPFCFNILTHRWQRKPQMNGDCKAKENTNAFSGIMLPTECNSRRIQQDEVAFFYPSNSKKPPVAT